jgi:fructose-1,6-bisphosphatase/inositol monophosphatase family enzyme
VPSRRAPRGPGVDDVESLVDPLAEQRQQLLVGTEPEYRAGSEDAPRRREELKLPRSPSADHTEARTAKVAESAAESERRGSVRLSRVIGHCLSTLAQWLLAAAAIAHIVYFAGLMVVWLIAAVAVIGEAAGTILVRFVGARLSRWRDGGHATHRARR